MKVVVLDACKKEMRDFPEGIKTALFGLISDLSSGLTLSMPISKKMTGMGSGVFELRLKDTSGAYRIIYLVKKKDAIFLVHAFKKKSAKTPKKNIDLASTRIRRL
ncbi:MAG: type II toxin-antitoxin system RelE/ParE family toxin [Bdellovibrionales bacterium]|jgi:phage-related protein|nr:type II toxin-antitoxin system RelE/ParE family toxin [Bdellovibrionales bacterium]MBT3524823.1 type II toxin-antitoxin system RelE/ParE family toxin [Bdellovibrionales bacterium]MBT7668965.1 type II toxin-antitoxin system RelE/ParE family toxin [Bdellovibrionales bacterium]MBT7767489.1 type II toxin-antitoxin system RelE/ParE family toxin [Bdellovibrionales bacterium]